MADIRINALATTAASTASDDFIAVDGSANGTRKLNAYSPTFGGNLTVSGTGLSSVAGTLNVTGALLAHQTAALNMAHEGSSLSQLVSYGADASTYGRLNVTLRKAGTGVGAVTALALTSTDATFGGNLTVSGTTGTIGSNSGFTWDLGSGGSFTALSTGRPTITAAVASGNNAGAALSLLPRGGGSRRTWNLETDTTEAGDCVLRQSTTEAGSTFTNALYFSAARNATLSGNLTVSGTGTSSVGGSFGIGTTTPTTINGVANAFQQVANVTGSGTCALNITGTQAILSLVDSNASANVKWLFLTNSNGVSTLGTLNDAGSTAQTGFQFFHSTGNFLFGTGSDGGQKLQVAGTGLFSTTEPTITLSSTAVGSIAYQLISGGGSGHTLGAFKIYDSSTGYVVLNHDKPTSGGTRLSFDGAGSATFAGTVIAGTWTSGTADKLKVSTAANDYAAYFANTAASGGSYGVRLHTNTTGATDYLLVASSGAGTGSTRFLIKSNGTLNAPSLPTSSAGLSAGDIWNDGGTLKIV